MQASELHELIKKKLPASGSLHYNTLTSDPNEVGRTMYFSPPGDEYYSIIKQTRSGNPGTTIEYHTPTHIYFLNDCWVETTLDMHNQYRTIMGSKNIIIPRCIEHEVIEIDYVEWVYNVFEKPVANAKTVQELVGITDADNSTVWNQAALHVVSTLNALAELPMGTKAIPTGWYTGLKLGDYYSNQEGAWYWKPPLTFTNRYNTDMDVYLWEAITWMWDVKSYNILNPHLHINPDFSEMFLKNLDSIYNVDLARERYNA